MMSSRLNIWIYISFVLICVFCKSIARNRNTLMELSPQEYFSILQTGKTSLVYFSQDVSLDITIFLEELKKAAGPLHNYGISVAKVNCAKEEASRYCGRENDWTKAYLFRGNILLREFPTDALFDVNAIVANVLFALLFNEIKYITSLEDFENIENAMKGKTNIALIYVRAIGTPEHRAVMETAFVYGTAYQFVLTTETALLEGIGAENSDVISGSLFFFHCKLVLDLTQKCQKTLLEQPLTILNIHRFLKLMDAPLLTEITEDPEKVSTIHLQLGLPQIFILSQENTYEMDKRTAEIVAWRLLGKAGVTLLLKDSSDLNIPAHINVIFKRAKEGVPVDFLVLHDVNSIISLVENNIPIQNNESVKEYEEGEMETLNLDIQDDQVVETVNRDSKRNLPLELIIDLTEETFNSIIMNTSSSIILFYANWEAVSLAFLQSYVDVAIKLKGVSNMIFSRINCGDWSNVCTKQNVTEYPVIKIFKEGEKPVIYTGMLETEYLLKFIRLNGISCPVKIVTIEEAEEYLNGELYKELTSYSSVSVLGIFSSSMIKEKENFIEAGKNLKGFVITGFYSEEDALILSKKYAVTLPALLFARHKEGNIDSILLSNSDAKDIIQIIKRALLGIFPEITVENLPIYLRLQKPLLILFRDDNLNHKDEKEMLPLVKQKYLETLIPCWLNVKTTPVGRGILKAYFKHLPPLPLLVLVDLHSQGQVSAFPLDQTINEKNILLWLQRLEAGLESHITTLSDEEWKPPLPAYNFLSRMDATVPYTEIAQFPIQNMLRCAKTTDLQQHDKGHSEDKLGKNSI
ncbi:thioredoxin domain-containing protein 16 isoform X1 [Dromiciops gliroides]|uniref:thioredoxin domain-containing protein 16 isoform X1 n=2 Tax=Dromiciops gliroides TaxID=33562 RepID=UPI001CC4C964|nr:thioredoxin domain-containing protein 16 isoform X1 [Dromiciops gliroides]XP_043844095.1 thioredoxin domain-containing protein 16 isoform X1 [Dromiciops gliroides]